MRASVLALAVLMASAWHGPASAQGSIEERLHRMEQRIRYLEQRLAAQDRTILQKDRQISGLKGEEDTPWFDKFGMSGKMEFEAAAVEDYQGTNITGIETVKVELDVAAEIDDWVSADVVLAMGDESGVEVDEAFLTLAPPDTPLSIQIGKQGLPFGVYRSGLISDALAKELGETREDAAVLNVEFGGLSASGFLFKGGLDRKGDDTAKVRNLGVALGYAMETDEASIGVNLSYLNDIGESDTVETAIADTPGGTMVPGGTASLIGSFGGMTVIAEYVTALEDFDAGELAYRSDGAKPAAWGVEAGYGWQMYGREVSAAIAWQRSMEAQGLDLPESRFLVGFSVELVDGLGLALEYGRDNDYGVGAGGTGKAANGAAMQLAAEF